MNEVCSMTQNHHKETCNTRRRVAHSRSVFRESTQRLQDAIKTKNICEMTVVQGLLDVANSNIEAARKKLEACSKKKELVDTKRRKVTDNVVAYMFTKNK